MARVHVRWSEPNRTPGLLDALALTGLLGFLVARFVPVARLPFWGCAFREATGYPCIGCGLTRVADRLSHFNVAGAFEANPLGALVACLFAALIVWSALHLVFKLKVPAVELTPKEGLWGKVGLGVVVALNYGFMLVRAGLGGA